MKNEPKPAAKEPDWNYRFHAVAFLDLMGQRQLFQPLVGVPQDPTEIAELKRVLGKTVRHIREFRGWFRDMFDAFQAPREIPSAIPNEFHDEYRKFQRTELHLQSVSDAVIAWSPIQTTTEADIPAAILGLWSILATTSTVQLMSLATEHPIRGGIEVDGGVTITPDSDEIYGKALNSAYEIEQRIAQYPRVVVGEGLIKFIGEMAQISGPPGTERYIRFGKAYAEQCRKLIAIDADGKHFVHFLGPGARELNDLIDKSKASQTLELLDAAYDFVRTACIEFQTDPKLGPRYKQLQKYFERFLPEWKK